MMSRIKRWLNRFTLSAGHKRAFLEGLSAQVQASVTPLQMFELTHASTKDLTMRSLAESSMASCYVGLPFSANYARDGFFDQKSAYLLEVAEKHDAIPEIVTLLLEEDADDQSFWGVVVFDNAQWILPCIGMLAILILGVEFEPSFTLDITNRADFFVLGEWLLTNLFALLILAGGVVAAYEFACRTLVGKTRFLLQTAGFAAVRDRRLNIALCKLFVALFEKGIPQEEALGIAKKVFADWKYASDALRNSVADMHSGAGFVKALTDNIFGDNLGLQVELLAGRASTNELKTAFSNLAQILTKESARALVMLRGLVAGIFALGLIALVIPLIDLITGTNLKP